MSFIDPGAPPPSDPRAIVAAQIAGLERRLAALERGRVARRERGYAESLEDLAVSGNDFESGHGPSVTIEVPAGGALIWIVGELQMRTTDPSGVDVAHAAVHWGLGATVVADNHNGALPTFKPFTSFPFEEIGGEMGNPLTRWVSGGVKTFEVLYAGTSVNGFTTHYSNRRLAVGLW